MAEGQKNGKDQRTESKSKDEANHGHLNQIAPSKWRKVTMQDWIYITGAIATVCGLIAGFMISYRHGSVTFAIWAFFAALLFSSLAFCLTLQNKHNTVRFNCFGCVFHIYNDTPSRLG